jgi:segregation and condensation protein B
MTPRPSRKKPGTPARTEETPETPETPESAANLETPEAPESPETTDAPETAAPESSETPADPETPENLENPDGPATEDGGEGADGERHSTPATDPALLRRALEALLFITDRPLSPAELAKLVGMRDQDRIVGAVEEIRRDLEAANQGYRLIAVAEGWQMATRPELAQYVRRLYTDRATMRLSTAAQETLSIIAYKQPLTRAEIEEIRGVEVIAALETLLEKRLVKVVGRKETVGRPLMYGTTTEFLRHFGLRSLEDMPPIDSFVPADDLPPSAVPADAESAPEPSVPAAEFAPQTEEAAVAEALSGNPGDAETAPAAEGEPEATGEDNEGIVGVALSEHPAGDAPAEETQAPAEGGDEDSVWPK